MATQTTLIRGFKAKAERISTEYREKLGIHACAPLCAFKLANYLKIPIYRATDFITDAAELKKLEGIDCEGYGWSALTMITKAGNRIIIHNNYHVPARQQSDIMHEIAHIICEHEVKLPPQGINLPLGMRDFDKSQEDEAIYLGATLQLSRPCLLWAKKNNMTNAAIAAHFNASMEMVNFRIGSTGINKQFSFRKNQVN
ncbi:ImmA/IrrE family metallo-endopeptidase [Flavobacterium salmonis]|uniref:IrrE N-terminal-like domain-containing protein n=1 Tax=Flavobacterium salmonis TaxID=2654844 RepID=A0A6V6YMT5_9FLAO|nr:ImmA/IrrE family metallo-endopeptidase [Flavobacterium salmonis]CAD0000755.1 hypothetical protein FLAT13_00199 [Flavobacterium salmonis]